MNAGFIKRSPVPFSSYMKKSQNRQLVIPSDVASDNNINNHIFTPRISDNVMSKSLLHYSPTLPVQQFNHPMDNNITTIHIAHIQTIMQSNELNPSSPIPGTFGGRISFFNHRSFHDLLSYNSTTDDSIFTSFLQLLCMALPDVHHVNTNFS